MNMEKIYLYLFSFAFYIEQSFLSRSSKAEIPHMS